MYDLVSHGFLHGYLGEKPWRELKDVSWLCPVPEYDRHFAITELFGIKMIPVRMNEKRTADMDEIEALVRENDVYQGNMVRPPVLEPWRRHIPNDTVARLASMPWRCDRFPHLLGTTPIAYIISTTLARPMSQTSPKRVRRPVPE